MRPAYAEGVPDGTGPGTRGEAIVSVAVLCWEVLFFVLWFWLVSLCDLFLFIELAELELVAFFGACTSCGVCLLSVAHSEIHRVSRPGASYMLYPGVL